MAKEATGGAAVGKTIAGRYRIQTVAHQGGRAIIYAARHEALSKRVALKLLPHDPDGKDAAENFLARAKLAASLVGPHVNRITDFGESPEGSYMVMDWLEGEHLSHWMTREETFALEKVLAFVRQIVQALGAAHARGVVHRAIAAEKVLLVRQGDEERVKVLGFGEPADPRGDGMRQDVRALGALLLDMASRARFDGVATFAVRRQREAELDPNVAQHVQKLPAGLQAVVIKALALEPAKAYRSAEDLGCDLERFQTGEIPDALLEMIASGSWALIPEEGSVAKIKRDTTTRVDRAEPVVVRARPATRRRAALVTRLARHRHNALMAALAVAGLVAGWTAAGAFVTEETAISSGTAHAEPSDFRAFGPDE